jgi:hypothetical protein
MNDTSEINDLMAVLFSPVLSVNSQHLPNPSVPKSLLCCEEHNTIICKQCAEALDMTTYHPVEKYNCEWCLLKWHLISWYM